MLKKVGFVILACLLIIATLFADVYGKQKGKHRKKRKKPIKKDLMRVKAPKISSKKNVKYGAAKKSSNKRRKTNGVKKTITPQVTDLTPAPKKHFVEDSTINIPVKPLPMMAEDTSTIGDGELSIVEEEEEVNVDSTWVKATEYYAIWDSKRVNPYRIDGTQFSDTINILLYDTAKNLNWAMPLKDTYITSRFGRRGYRFHYGTDLELDTGDSVFAAFDGIVRVRHYDRRGYGNHLVVRHYNGLETLYGHLSRAEAEPGQLVKAGDFLGFGGSTGRSSGPHLHFEVRYQGNPINPEDMYDFRHKKLYSDEFVLTPGTFNYITKSARKLTFHRIRSGDTLGGIARKYGTTVRYLCRVNGISPRSVLRSGKRLRIR